MDYFYWDIGSRLTLRREVGLMDYIHLHADIELVYLLSGSAVAYADYKPFQLNAGDVFIAFSNQIHYYETPDGPPSHLIMSFLPQLVPEFAELLTGSVPVSNVIPAEHVGMSMEPLLRFTEHIPSILYIDEYPQNELIIRGFLLAALAQLTPHMEYKRADNGKPEAVQRILTYCTNNYLHPFSLSDMANDLNINSYQISRIFSTRLRTGFKEYVNKLRIDEARRLLKYSEMSIADISCHCGFDTQRTFNRVFDRYSGMTPSAYRDSGLSGG